ncbi:MAG: MauE/DoxX family redox-associated membrane protein [Elusimicrobiota bacterium]
MKNKKYIEFFFLLLRLFCGGIFIYASLYKIASPGEFAHQIYNYKLLPTWAINPMAIILPWFQLLCGFSLVLNRFQLGASLGTVLMMIAFQIGLMAALLRGLNISCGCFKSGGSPATWFTFLRDFLFLLACLAVFLKNRHQLKSCATE